MAKPMPASNHINLSIADGTADQRVAFWRQAIRPSGEIEIAENDAARFTGELHGNVLDEILAVNVRSSPFRIIRDRNWVRQVTRDMVLINTVVDGQIKGTYRRKPFRAPAGSLTITRLAGETDIETPLAWKGLLVPRTKLEKEMVWHEGLDGRIFAPTAPITRIIDHHIDAILSMPKQSRNQIGRVENVTLQMLRGCFAGTLKSRKVIPTQGNNVSRQILRYVVEQLANPALNSDLICREFAFSSAHLKRTLGKGFKLAETIRRLRIHQAAQEIASHRQSRSISEIALRCGIADERTFRRVFRQELGCSPTDFRNNPIGADRVRAFDDLELWFKGISAQG
jgi:AraC-like DNA-binding protein